MPLNDTGLEQVHQAVPHLKQVGITRVIASDLARAYRTGAVIAQALDVPIEKDRRWREVDLGRWQGLKRADMFAWDGEHFRDFEQADYIERRFPEGESNRQHIARVAAALEDVVANYPGEHVMVATHGGSIRSAVYKITGEVMLITGNCSITRLHHEDGAWHMAGLAEMPASILW